MNTQFNTRYLALCIGCSLMTSTVQAQQITTDQEPHADKTTEVVQILGHKTNLVGDAISASQGLIGQEEIEIRPLLRTGEILESIPGMVVTQHSGTGKANQYFQFT